MDEVVFKPLGMTSSSYGGTRDFKAFVMADPPRKSGVVMFANAQDALNIAKPIIDTAMDTDSLAFAWLK